MTTSFGPHLLQVPNTRLDFHPSYRLSTFRGSIRAWKPLVCLLNMDILDEAHSKGWNKPAATSQISIRNAAALSVTDLRTMIVGHSHPLTLGTSREQALRYYVQPILETAELSSMQLIGRIFIEDRIVAHHIKSDPEAAAQYHHNLVVASRMILHDYNNLKLDTRVHHWVIVNEVLADGRDNLARLARYERRRMELAGTDYGCGPFAFANANPALIGSPAGLFEKYDISSGHSTEITTLSRWQGSAVHDALADANEHNQDNPGAPQHILLLHQYFKPDPSEGGTHEPEDYPRIPHAGIWTDGSGHITDFNYNKNVGRFDHHILPWFLATYPHLKVIMSEYGADGRIGRVGEAQRKSLGWKEFSEWNGSNAHRYLAALKSLERRNHPFRKVIKGYCLFALGDSSAPSAEYPKGEFWSYRLEVGPGPDSKGVASILEGLVSNPGLLDNGTSAQADSTVAYGNFGSAA